MTPIFPGSVESGCLKLQDRHRFDNYLNSLKGPIEVIVRKEVRRRTNPQNRWYWGVAVKMIAKETGHEPSEIHDALKGAFSPKVVIGNLVAPKSTRTMDTIDFGDNMMEKVVAWAAEYLHLHIPLPGRLLFRALEDHIEAVVA